MITYKKLLGRCGREVWEKKNSRDRVLSRTQSNTISKYIEHEEDILKFGRARSKHTSSSKDNIKIYKNSDKTCLEDSQNVEIWLDSSIHTLGAVKAYHEHGHFALSHKHLQTFYNECQPFFNFWGELKNKIFIKLKNLFWKNNWSQQIN